MTEEIKEILNKLKNENNYQVDCNDGSAFKELFANEIYLLLDYITNLQQENEKLKYNARGQVNDYFKDKYADEILKNAKLKEENKELNRMCELYSKSLYNAELTDYKSRCLKAIEELTYMSTDAYTDNYDIRDKHYNLLMNILNGSDDK